MVCRQIHNVETVLRTTLWFVQRIIVKSCSSWFLRQHHLMLQYLYCMVVTRLNVRYIEATIGDVNSRMIESIYIQAGSRIIVMLRYWCKLLDAYQEYMERSLALLHGVHQVVLDIWSQTSGHRGVPIATVWCTRLAVGVQWHSMWMEPQKSCFMVSYHCIY